MSLLAKTAAIAKAIGLPPDMVAGQTLVAACEAMGVVARAGRDAASNRRQTHGRHRVRPRCCNPGARSDACSGARPWVLLEPAEPVEPTAPVGGPGDE